MKRFVQVKNSKVVDTMLLIPHVECYLKQDGRLFVEYILGDIVDLGKIVKEADTLEELVNMDPQI
jgi:hypothetical protein